MTLFLDPEIVKMVRFLDPEISKMVDRSYISPSPSYPRLHHPSRPGFGPKLIHMAIVPHILASLTTSPPSEELIFLGVSNLSLTHRLRTTTCRNALAYVCKHESSLAYVCKHGSSLLMSVNMGHPCLCL